MMKTFCNPVNLEYRFCIRGRKGTIAPFREGADPGAVLWHDKYWLVTSKGAGVHWSTDLVNWHCVHDNILPYEGYAPDLIVYQGKLLYLVGISDTTVFEAVDPERGLWKPYGEPWNLADPKLFADDDGRMYMYHGCTPDGPLYGAEVDTETILPKTDWLELLYADPQVHGWERNGENNIPGFDFLREQNEAFGHTSVRPDKYVPWNEGVFLNKHNGKYYLQNSTAGTSYNVYTDAISISDSPLGPFTFQKDNPFSLKPGGFITGAGHSCDMADKYGNLFHFSTMRIAKRFIFERRVGMFPAGFMDNGEMYCKQRFGDFPHYIPEQKFSYDDDFFTGWMLLSYGAAVQASSAALPAENAVDENIRTQWAAEKDDPAPTLTVDLGSVMTVRAVQINFSEQDCCQYAFDGPGGAYRYLLEGSADGDNWITLADQRKNTEDKTHQYHDLETEQSLRFVRLTVNSIPAGGAAAVSGLRVFGSDGSGAPCPPENFKAVRSAEDPVKVTVSWTMPENAYGVNVRWGVAPDRLHHCWQTLKTSELTFSSLDAACNAYYIALESFGRGGVSPLTEIICLKKQTVQTV